MSDDAERLARAVQAHLEREGYREARVVAVRRSRARAGETALPSSIACLGLRGNGDAPVHRVGAERWVVLLEMAGARTSRCYVCHPCAATALAGRQRS